MKKEPMRHPIPTRNVTGWFLIVVIFLGFRIIWRAITTLCVIFTDISYSFKMDFKVIDKETWSRKPYFDHYFSKVRCTYSMTVNLDITGIFKLKKSLNVKLYPLLVYALAKAVNSHEEFRTELRGDGVIGVWDVLHPCYTVFHKETETFSNIWTEWDDDLSVFLSRFNVDMDSYGNVLEIDGKPGVPPNVFPVSVLPWASFTGFNLNIYTEGDYLLPIFTYGKYFSEGERCMIPLSVQVHHAVCDGFHVCRLVNDIQRILDAVDQKSIGLN